MFGLGMWEALILLAVVMLLFGGKKLPELAKSMGKSITSFKKGLKEDEENKQKISDSDKDEGPQ